MKFETAIKLIFILLILFLAALIFVGVTSCNVTKSKQTKDVDSSYTKTESDVSLQEKKANISSETDWQRQIIEYPTPVIVGGDTTINNYYQYPARVIYETGSNKTEKQFESRDTTSSEKKEEKKVSIEETEKDKKTTTNPIWMVLIIWGAWELIKLAASYFKGKFSIVKK